MVEGGMRTAVAVVLGLLAAGPAAAQSLGGFGRVDNGLLLPNQGAGEKPPDVNGYEQRRQDQQNGNRDEQARVDAEAHRSIEGFRAR